MRLPARPSRIAVADAAALGAVAIGVVVLAAGSAGSGSRAQTAPPVSPSATVREFLRTATVEKDAVGACEFLTPAERRRVEAAGGCDAFAARLGRRPHPALLVRGRGRDLTVYGLGAPRTFRVAPLPRASRPEQVAPASGWRIARGAAALLR
ncbi:MAG TPA: hypothetical protein VHF89_15100 [Solirubrobacteraceae bacterium]|nr:hypothetical protein [Solirubrobacteraceae bacterium]